VRFGLAVLVAAVAQLAVYLQVGTWIGTAALLATAYILFASLGAGWFAARRSALAGGLSALLGAAVYGVSTQDTGYQREAAERLHLPFELLSDSEFVLTDALRRPTFHFEGVRLLKRLTLIVRADRIEHVFYPVFPPDRHAEEVLTWLSQA